MPRVLNAKLTGKRKPGAVYCGRPSKFGNPFVLGRDGGRDEVIAKYRQMLERRPELRNAARAELRGFDLICWCAPLACHCDVLLELANGVGEGA